MRILRATLTLVILSGVGTAKADDFNILLATKLSANPAYLIANLPPRPDVWPGAIFTWNMRIPIKHGDPKDPALRRGIEVAIGANEALDASVNARGGYASWLGLSATVSDVANISMSLPDVTVIDMDFEDLVKRAQTESEIIASAKRGQAPVIVVKSYEATPQIIVTKKMGASTEAWAKLKRDAQVGVKAAADTENTITYQGLQPIIIAFETEQILVNLDDLAHNKITITFASLPSTIFYAREEITDPLFAIYKDFGTKNSGDAVKVNYNENIAKVLRDTNGISIKDINSQGLFGGPNSVFRKPFG